MIAELHGKISHTGSNLHDHLEDQLTGDVFGTLRYLPFAASMKPILLAAHIPMLSDCIQTEKTNFWGDCIAFWPYHEEGELDALLELEDAVIGIEVKYRSGISLDDGVGYDISSEAQEELSENQLARESRIVKEKAEYSGKKAFLLFIADDAKSISICENVQNRPQSILAEGVTLGHISWQEILIVIEKMLCDARTSNKLQEECILSDISALLRRKGFVRFQSFQMPAMQDFQVVENDSFTYKVCLEEKFAFSFKEPIESGDYYEYR